MIAFFAKKLASGLVLIVVVAAVTFFLLGVTSSSVARGITGQNATQEQVAAKAAELGLDQPVVTRFGSWLMSAVQGNLGASWFSGQPVTSALANALPVTLSIVLGALLISAVLSVLLGVAAAVRGGWVDRTVQILAVVGFAIPSFLIALVLAAVIGVKLGWLPATGYIPFVDSPSGWLSTITLPAISLAIGAIAAIAQQIRGSMIDVLRMDYIRTLRSRGISEKTLLFQHALRNAGPPGLTVLSLQFIGLVGGAVVVEKVFGLQGIGSLASDSANSGDAPVVMGVTLIMVILVVVVNLLLDLAYGWLNPKVRVA